MSREYIWCTICGRTTCDGCFTTPMPSDKNNNASKESDGTKDGNMGLSSNSIEAARDGGTMATPDEFEAFLTGYMGDAIFAKRFANCMTTMRSKNADYSQNEHKGDRIAAFRRISRDVNIPMTKVWAVFCQKHWGAIMRFIKDGHVESEPIDGRINDMINYLALLGPIIQDGDSK